MLNEADGWQLKKKQQQKPIHRSDSTVSSILLFALTHSTSQVSGRTPVTELNWSVFTWKECVTELNRAMNALRMKSQA